MALTPDQKKRLKNHIPTVQRTCEVFLSVIDTDSPSNEKQIDYLLDLIDKMETDLAGTKDILKE